MVNAPTPRPAAAWWRPWSTAARNWCPLKIDPEVATPDDVEMLQDLVLAAINEALNRSREMVAQEMSKLTGGMSIPGMFG